MLLYLVIFSALSVLKAQGEPELPRNSACQNREFIDTATGTSFYRHRCFSVPGTYAPTFSPSRTPTAAPWPNRADFTCAPFQITGNTYFATNSNTNMNCVFTACPGDRVLASTCLSDGGTCSGDAYFRLLETASLTNALIMNDNICVSCPAIEYSFSALTTCQSFTVAQGCSDGGTACAGQTAIKYVSYTPCDPVECEMDLFYRNYCQFPDPGPGTRIVVQVCPIAGAGCTLKLDTFLRKSRRKAYPITNSLYYEDLYENLAGRFMSCPTTCEDIYSFTTTASIAKFDNYAFVAAAFTDTGPLAVTAPNVHKFNVNIRFETCSAQ